MESEAAPTELEYDLELPEGSVLDENADGSITILAPVETETFLPGEEARVGEAVQEILDADSLTLDDIAELTDEQLDQLAAIPEAETETHTELSEIAMIEEPWAVDASGALLETRYDIERGVLTQVIHTDDETQFPVVADPSVWWWIGTAVTCAAQVGALFVNWAKLPSVVAKAQKIVNNSKKLKAAVDKLGGLKKTVSTIKAYATKKSNLTKAERTYLSSLGVCGADMLSDLFGIGSCVSMLKQIKV